MARAFGSYPECRWFESDRRYHEKQCVSHDGCAVFYVQFAQISAEKQHGKRSTSVANAFFLHKMNDLFNIVALPV